MDSKAAGNTGQSIDRAPALLLRFRRRRYEAEWSNETNARRRHLRRRRVLHGGLVGGRRAFYFRDRNGRSAPSASGDGAIFVSAVLACLCRRSPENALRIGLPADRLARAGVRLGLRVRASDSRRPCRLALSGIRAAAGVALGVLVF